MGCPCFFKQHFKKTALWYGAIFVLLKNATSHRTTPLTTPLFAETFSLGLVCVINCETSLNLPVPATVNFTHNQTCDNRQLPPGLITIQSSTFSPPTTVAEQPNYLLYYAYIYIGLCNVLRDK